ncbi:TetR/AcrR family transcriptional regulator C-terminal ligand-binding domain-containing protein [Nocardia sp. R6R-6]|uniref:TetR/AcrR family transcriptional regulator C-terminal ligand-binding domain-containing protein n=1 Tax=Nocardia sp. R6R-6 TaxID=3459303 RepID=UPI00403D7C0E
MAKASMARPVGRPPSKEIDRAVLEATVDALAEVGFDALSVADVARRASSTTPSIYRRFPGKTELVVAAVDYELARLPSEPPDLGSLRADLVALARLIADALTPKRTRILAALMLAAATTPEPAQRLTAAVEHLASSTWTTLTERAARRGEFINDGGTLIPRLPAAVIISFAVLGHAPPDTALIEELIDAVMLPALTPPSRTSTPESETDNHDHHRHTS